MMKHSDKLQLGLLIKQADSFNLEKTNPFIAGGFGAIPLLGSLGAGIHKGYDQRDFGAGVAQTSKVLGNQVSGGAIGALLAVLLNRGKGVGGLLNNIGKGGLIGSSAGGGLFTGLGQALENSKIEKNRRNILELVRGG